VDELTNYITNLVGDVYLASAAMSYYGPFTGAYRDQLVDLWLDKIKSLSIPCSDSFSLENLISSNLEVRNWRVCNLPSDKVSICNACLATKSLRYPIMIDPQELAYSWLTRLGSKKMKTKNEELNQFKAIKAGDKQALKSIEKGIEFGWTILYYDCGEKLENNIDLLLMQKSNNIGDFTEGLE